LLELYNPINKSEESEVTSSSNVCTSMKCASALSNKDAAGINNFTAKPLNAKPLSSAITSVSGTSYRFFMSHESPMQKLMR
jgi:Neuraminidase (sialidase)